VQDALGGSGSVGFTYLIPAVHTSLFSRPRTVSVRELVTKNTFGNRSTPPVDFSRNLSLHETILNELQRVKELLHTIESQLPRISSLFGTPLESYSEYRRRYYVTETEGVFLYNSSCPLISIIIPIFNTPVHYLLPAIESVASQSYANWELILVDDSTDHSTERQAILNRYFANYPDKVRLLSTEGGSGTSAATNVGLGVASGHFVAFLDHDDMLDEHALSWVAAHLLNDDFDLLYSDEDRFEIGEDGSIMYSSPHFKPNFDPDLLLSYNYICHLLVVRLTIASALGFRSELNGVQDHDFLLRLIEVIDISRIRHVPAVLYHWRRTPGSISNESGNKNVLESRLVSCVNEHIVRTGKPANAEAHFDQLGNTSRAFSTRIKWFVPAEPPMVSIIIPTKDRVDLLGPCLSSLLVSLRNYQGEVEIIVVDHESVQASTHALFRSLAGSVRLLPYHGEFNWSAINNYAARESNGGILIFLNNDTVVLEKNWCSEIVSNACRPDVGAVGTRLLYEDGTIQHAGVLVGVEGVGGHEGLGQTVEDGGYFGRTHVQRSVSAVTGACLATRREVFESVDGFDQLQFQVAFNDVDFCLRIMEKGYRIVYTPFATFYHFESKSRGFDTDGEKKARHDREALRFRKRWGKVEDIDRYYNIHFERYAPPFKFLRPFKPIHELLRKRI
jgi:GT2 family glycosyltransferase